MRQKLYGIFLLSGVAALLYQVVWLQWIALVFGVTAHAIGTALAVFMGGLAIGSLGIGMLSDRITRPLRLYAYLELGIAATAGLTPIWFPYLLTWVAANSASSTGGWQLALLRLGGTALILAPPTILMGGTLPTLARAGVLKTEEAGSILGRLYAANTLGGALGAVLTGYVLIGWLGLTGTLAVGILCNLAGAFLAQQLERSHPAPLLPSPSPPETPKAPRPQQPILATAMLLGLFAAGCAGLAAEVVWMRLVKAYLNNTSHAFSIILGVYLVALVIGSAIAGPWADRTRRPDRGYALLLLLAGASIVLFGFLEVLLPDIIHPLWRSMGWDHTPGSQNTLHVETLIQVVLRPLGLWHPVVFRISRAIGHALILLFVPCLFFGMAFPFANRYFAQNPAELGKRIGGAGMANMLGATIGPLLWGFVILPALGMQRALLATSLLLVASAAAVWMAGHDKPLRAGSITAIGTVLLAVLLSLIPDIFVSGTYGRLHSKPIYHEEDLYGTVMVVEEHKPFEAFQRLLVGSTSMITDQFSSKRYTRLLGHAPMILHPQPDRPLVICLGSGMTLSAIAAHPTPSRIDCAELSPGIVRACRKHFSEANDNVLDDPRVRLFLNDGRNHLLGHPKTYDIISLEPPPPTFRGVTALYSTDFYELCKRSLRGKGMVVQWISLHTVTHRQAIELIASMQAVFPNCTVWDFLHGAELGVIGTLDDKPIPYARVVQRMMVPRVRSHLAQIGIRSPADFYACRLMGAESIAELCKGVTHITDDRPKLGYDLDSFYLQNSAYPKIHGYEALLGAQLRAAGAADPLLLSFANANEEAEFRKHYRISRHAQFMHLQSICRALLPGAYWPEVPTLKEFTPPIHIDPGNVYYEKTFIDGIYNAATAVLIKATPAVNPPSQRLRARYISLLGNLDALLQQERERYQAVPLGSNDQSK